MDLKTEVSRLDLKKFLRNHIPETDINFQAGISATIPPDFSPQRIEATMAVDLFPSTINGLALDGGSLDLLATGGRVTIESLRAKSGSTSFNSQARLDFSTGKFKGSIFLLSKDPDQAGQKIIDALIPAKTRKKYFGLTSKPGINIKNGQIDISFSGRMKTDPLNFSAMPQAARISVSVTAKNAGIAENSITDLDIKVTCDIREGSFQIKASGRAAAVSIPGILLEENHINLSLAKKRAVFHARTVMKGYGKIAVSGVMTPALELPSRVTLSELKLACGSLGLFVNAGPIETVIFHDRVLIRKMNIKAGRGLLSIKGDIPYSSTDPVNIDIETKGLDAGKWFPRLSALTGRDLPGASGGIEARLHIGERLSSPCLSAKLKITPLSFPLIEISSITGDIVYKDNKFRINLSASIDNQTTIEAKGSLDAGFSIVPFRFIPAKNAWDITITSWNFRLEKLPGTKSDDFSVAGNIAASIRLTGPLDAPSLSGRVDISKGRLDLPGLGLHYERMQATIIMSGDSIKIVELLIEGKKTGRLECKGEIKTRGISLQRFDLSLKGEKFAIPYKNAVLIHARPDLNLTGDIESPMLSGTIHIIDGKIFSDRFWEAGPAEIAITGEKTDENGIIEVGDIGKNLKNPYGIFAPLRANVKLKAKKNLWIKGEAENIEIAGELTLTKNKGEPMRISGPVRAVRGTYLFRNRIFTITEGEMNFTGKESIDPEWDILARTRINDAIIIARLGGTFFKPTIELSSEPFMDQVDIVSYLMFGRPASALSSGESFQAAAAAMSFAGKIAADELKEILGKAFALDMIYVSAEEGDISQGSIAIGKYITPELFVTVKQKFSGSAPGMEIDYEINRHFSIEAFVEEDAASAIDIIWRHDF